jgi:cell division protease FtsH
VRRVTIVPRGQALGVTISVPEADRYNYSEDYLRVRIVNALGGRAAEQVVYGVVTTGAEDDLRQVTNIARAMVTRWGMSDDVGLLALSGVDEGNFIEGGAVPGQSRPYSEDTARAIDRATKQIVDDAYATAIDLLTRERSRLDALAQALLREESLDLDEMLKATGLPGRPAVPEDSVAAVR